MLRRRLPLFTLSASEHTRGNIAATADNNGTHHSRNNNACTNACTNDCPTNACTNDCPTNACTNNNSPRNRSNRASYPGANRAAYNG